MSFIKKLWVNFSAPLLMLEVSVMMLTLAILWACKFNEAFIIFTELIFILVELVLIASMMGLNIYTLVKAIKDKDVLAIVLTILFAGFYAPFYHQKKDGYSLAWPIVSVSLLGILYLGMILFYFIFMILLFMA